MKRDFYLDVYTILNRILLTILTICTIRVSSAVILSQIVQELQVLPQGATTSR